jgi:hypothetical protein
MHSSSISYPPHHSSCRSHSRRAAARSGSLASEVGRAARSTAAEREGICYTLRIFHFAVVAANVFFSSEWASLVAMLLGLVAALQSNGVRLHPDAKCDWAGMAATLQELCKREQPQCDGASPACGDHQQQQPQTPQENERPSATATAAPFAGAPLTPAENEGAYRSTGDFMQQQQQQLLQRASQWISPVSPLQSLTDTLGRPQAVADRQLPLVASYHSSAEHTQRRTSTAPFRKRGSFTSGELTVTATNAKLRLQSTSSHCVQMLLSAERIAGDCVLVFTIALTLCAVSAIMIHMADTHYTVMIRWLSRAFHAQR